MRTTICEVIRSSTPGENRFHVAISQDDGTPPVKSSGASLDHAMLGARIEQLIEKGLEHSPEADKLRELLEDLPIPERPGRR